MDDDEQDELRCTGSSDAEIEEYTDTEDSPYNAAYQNTTDKFFDTDQIAWEKFSFVATLVVAIISVTVLIVSHPLHLESIEVVSNAYTGTYT